MDKLQYLLMTIGVIQVILGIVHLTIPARFYAAMGLTVPPDDNHYFGGMLAARFIAYGIGMFVVARNPERHVFWIYNMIFIQVIDLVAGLIYTMRGTITLKTSLFPMFNASLFIVLLSLWAPKFSL